MTLKIYLAGPEVFLPGFGADVFAEKKRLCAEHGFSGISPMDGELDTAHLPPFEQGLAIYRGNIGHMRNADAIVANMTPFRGVSMDSGTAFEMGFMAALGKPVLGYTNVTAGFAERSDRYYLASVHAGTDPYTAGTSIERFDMADNLMMVGAAAEAGFPVIATKVEPGQELRDLQGFAACLRLLAGKSL